jgi:hypothetical protein
MEKISPRVIPHRRDAMVFASFCRNKKKEEHFGPFKDPPIFVADQKACPDEGRISLAGGKNVSCLVPT